MATEFVGINHASVYNEFRPKVDPQVIDKILQFLKVKQPAPFSSAVDVACGSGQSTHILGEHFESVLGCDISEAQVTEARRVNTASNIQYCVADAKHIPVADSSVDLVTCAQAAHWLDFPAFCKEIDRVLKPRGCLAVYTHIFPRIFLHDDDKKAKKLNEIIANFRYQTLNGYWGYPVERLRDIYEQDLVIPYSEFQRHVLYEYSDISLLNLLGYQESLSAYQNYHKEHINDNILTALQDEIKQTLDVDKPPDEIICKTMYSISVLLGRKPQTS